MSDSYLNQENLDSGISTDHKQSAINLRQCYHYKINVKTKLDVMVPILLKNRLYYSKLLLVIKM